MIYLRNDDIAYDTNPNDLKQFCEIVDKFGGFYKIVHAVNTDGKVVYHEKSNEMIKALSIENIIDNKELINFLYTRKDKDLFCTHGKLHLHCTELKDFKEFAEESLIELKKLPFVTTKNLIPWFVYPFNEHNTNTDNILEDLDLIPMHDKNSQHLEHLAMGLKVENDLGILRLHSWRFSKNPTLLLNTLSTTLFLNNEQVYNSQEVADHYLNEKEELQKPEQTILKKFKNQFKDMNMLDLGVGTGRTTKFFADLVKEYVGVDYSAKMIDICKDKFKLKCFINSDIKQMDFFEDNYFDFILGSFNVIDYLSYEDRLTALFEIKRICKNNGFFCFSSHNIQSQSTLKGNGAIINDAGLNYKLVTYYIKPSEEVAQLEKIGFKNIEVYDLAGNIINDTDLDSVKDCWLYYLCQKEENKLNIKVVTNQIEFNKLHTEWNKLLSNSKANNFFLTWEWLYNWWIEYNSQLFILSVYELDQLVGIAPFIKEDNKICFMGTGMICSDYLDIICLKDKEFKVCEAIFNYLKSIDFQEIFLRDILESSLTIQYLALNYKCFDIKVGLCTKCPYINLNTLGVNYFKSLHKKIQKNIRYYDNKLPKDIQFITAVNENELDKYMKALTELHKKRWDTQDSKDGFTDRLIKLHFKIAPILFKKGWLQFYALEDKDKIIAILYCFRYNNKIYFYQSGFDPEYSNLSPGFLTIVKAIQYSIIEGLNEFDFIRGASDYKYKLARQERSTLWLSIHKAEFVNYPNFYDLTNFQPLASLQLTDVGFMEKSNEEYSIIKEFIKKPNKVLDLGCGLSRMSVFLNWQWQDPNIKFILADFNQINKNLTYGWNPKEDIYNDLNQTTEFVKKHGLKNFEIFDLKEDLTKLKDIDLVYSFLAVGFHFPIEPYIKNLLKITSSKCQFIFGVRKGKYKIEDFQQYFNIVKIFPSKSEEDILLLEERRG